MRASGRNVCPAQGAMCTGFRYSLLRLPAPWGSPQVSNQEGLAPGSAGPGLHLRGGRGLGWRAADTPPLLKDTWPLPKAPGDTLWLLTRQNDHTLSARVTWLLEGQVGEGSHQGAQVLGPGLGHALPPGSLVLRELDSPLSPGSRGGLMAAGSVRPSPRPSPSPATVAPVPAHAVRTPWCL